MTATSSSVLFCYYLILTGGVRVVNSGFSPVIYSSGSSSECGQYDLLEDEQVAETIRLVHQQLGPPGCNPPRNRSCQEILHCFSSAPSGYYQITAPNGSPVQVYCDMEGINCGGEGGWMRVAYVNMSQSGITCPQGLTQRNLSGLTLCGRSSGGGPGCQSTVFSTLGLNYAKVCGQLRGFYFGTPDAFHPYIATPTLTLDSVYVDGVSITFGNSPRRHIWTYATGLNLNYKSGPTYECPCNTGVNTMTPPYVGSDYYCETALHSSCCDFNNLRLFPDDPLWDGQQCIGIEASCCTHPNMPWFNKTLNETTTDDIELRVCADEAVANEDSPLQVIELFIR